MSMWSTPFIPPSPVCISDWISCVYWWSLKISEQSSASCICLALRCSLVVTDLSDAYYCTSLNLHLFLLSFSLNQNKYIPTEGYLFPCNITDGLVFVVHEHALNLSVCRWPRTLAGITAYLPCKRQVSGAGIYSGSSAEDRRAWRRCGRSGQWAEDDYSHCEYMKDVTRVLYIINQVDKCNFAVEPCSILCLILTHLIVVWLMSGICDSYFL